MSVASQAPISYHHLHLGQCQLPPNPELCGLCTVLILPCFAAQKLALQPITVRVQAQLFLSGPRYGSAYTTRTPRMEHHVLRWIGSPLEDCPSVSNVSTQSLVRLLTYRMSHGHGIHLDTSQAYWPNPRQITIRCTLCEAGTTTRTL